MHSKYSRDFRNFKNRTVFRLVVKYSIETTKNWFGHVRVFLAAIVSIESVAKQHFTRQKDILICNKRARASTHTHTHTPHSIAIHDIILVYVYNTHASTHRSALKYTYITLIYVLCLNTTAELFKLFHRIHLLAFLWFQNY